MTMKQSLSLIDKQIISLTSTNRDRHIILSECHVRWTLCICMNVQHPINPEFVFELSVACTYYSAKIQRSIREDVSLCF